LEFSTAPGKKAPGTRWCNSVCNCILAQNLCCQL
jgi:hypothetical protein